MKGNSPCVTSLACSFDKSIFIVKPSRSLSTPNTKTSNPERITVDLVNALPGNTRERSKVLNPVEVGQLTGGSMR